MGQYWEAEDKLLEKEPLVSVVMPVYNSEKYVAEAIRSVQKQSYENWELLIVNDGSTDHSAEIIEAYARKDFRIKIFHKKNEGVSETRNFALTKVCGQYVTFIDGDDVYHHERLYRMAHIFEQYPDCDIIFSRHMEFIGEVEVNEISGSGKLEISDNNILVKTISDSKNHFMCNTMIKTEIAKKVQFHTIRFAEDFCYIRDCVWHCRKMAVLDEVLYYYRRDNENAMTSHFFSEKYIVDYMKLTENIYDFCKNHELKDKFYKNLVGHEYAQNSMRIRKSTSFIKFVECMNNEKFREGISFAETSQCTFFEKTLFFMVKHKIYFPFAFWVW